MLSDIQALLSATAPEITWWQMAIRAVIVFVFGILLVRVGARRMFGHNASFDIIMAVILGSILSRALTGNAPFIPALAAATALVLLHWLLAVLAFHSRIVGWLVKGTKRQLVADGTVDWSQMRGGKVSREDLMEALRLKGFNSISALEAAYLERGGDVSAVPKRRE